MLSNEMIWEQRIDSVTGFEYRLTINIVSTNLVWNAAGIKADKPLDTVH